MINNKPTIKPFLHLLFITGIILCENTSPLYAQLLNSKHEIYTRKDSLRGSLNEKRLFDVKKYNLEVKVDIEKQFISGVNHIDFTINTPLPIMQLDLFSNMKVDSIVYKNKKLNYTREFNAVFINLPKNIPLDSKQQLSFYYSGNPKIAKNAPWDGGFIFTTDSLGNPWVSVAVQGTGASLWFPNKDHQSDEPNEGAEINIIVPETLVAVSNGKLTHTEALPKQLKKYSWKVVNPINNYNIILNIGNYTLIEDKFNQLALKYYVLEQHKKEALKQFAQVKPMLACFNQKFGEYPFTEDSYKLVETPFLGMEHQSAIAYGNHFKNGYLGKDLSQTGVGLKWDFIIVHESAHEWFGNSITAADIADMWIHEAFTSYAEAVFVECQWGTPDALSYLEGVQKIISNTSPIIGDYGVNKEGSPDMYYKGANMLNSIRSTINNDKAWWELLKNFSISFKHRITNSEEVIAYFDKHTKAKITPIFKHYLYQPEIPILEIKKHKKGIAYRWKNTAKNFRMPVEIVVNQKSIRLKPSSKRWKKIKNITPQQVTINHKRFYVALKINEN
ncbi:MAG: M1 family metallopeptidase [Mesonia hippocampi]|uniref:M1 family metallopeptidase n=1 Tax=Mesonia hippocampi TaxID=1628250 RepID=UPI003F9E6010